MFDKTRFLDLVRDFVVFEDDGGGGLVKKMAGYHQFHAVRVAVEQTLRAVRLDPLAAAGGGNADTHGAGRRQGGAPGDRRIGVVWHTQGVRQELDHGLLRRSHHSPGGYGEPDHRGPDRP